MKRGGIAVDKNDFCDLMKIILVALACPLLLPIVANSPTQEELE